MEGQQAEVEAEAKAEPKIKTKLDEILEHLHKPKKLTLPKGYVRKQKANIEFLEIKDNLTTDNSSNFDKNNIINKDDGNDKKVVPKDDGGKKTKKPTAYNIFVKETVVRLQETHKDLTPKERFKLSIKMWSDNKSK
jgi:YABBY protein